jgi:uncharacterized protein
LWLKRSSDHFAGVKAKQDGGEWKMGGAYFSEPPQGDDPAGWKFAGSTLVVVAATRDEVVKDLEGDIYTRSGVWDVANVRTGLEAAI